MNVLTDKFTFTEEFVFIDSKQSNTDWDEMDLQLFDGTSTVQPDITKDTEVVDIAKVLGISTEKDSLSDNSESGVLVPSTSPVAATPFRAQAQPTLTSRLNCG